MNTWNIPDWMEKMILERDLACVYCHVEFAHATSRRERPTWEHIVNDARIVTLGNIARCCMSCNASKGAKELTIWLESGYCKRKGITPERVAHVVREALLSPPQPPT
jgi:hypothetical protein